MLAIALITLHPLHETLALVNAPVSLRPNTALAEKIGKLESALSETLAHRQWEARSTHSNPELIPGFNDRLCATKYTTVIMGF